MRNWEYTNYTCKGIYVSHIAFLIKWLSQSQHSQSKLSQNGLQPKWLYKPENYPIRAKKEREFWSEMPLSKDIIEKWSKLKDKIIEESENICNHFGLAFDIEVEKDCLEKCHFCIVNDRSICIDSGQGDDKRDVCRW